MCVSAVLSFLWLSSILQCVCIYPNSFIDSPVERHLDSFQFVAIMKKVAMNMIVFILGWTYVFNFWVNT